MGCHEHDEGAIRSEGRAEMKAEIVERLRKFRGLSIDGFMSTSSMSSIYQDGLVQAIEDCIMIVEDTE